MDIFNIWQTTNQVDFHITSFVNTTHTLNNKYLIFINKIQNLIANNNSTKTNNNN